MDSGRQLVFCHERMLGDSDLFSYRDYQNPENVETWVIVKKAYSGLSLNSGF